MPIVSVDLDTAGYYGSDEDGVYVCVAYHPGSRRRGTRRGWYVTTVVDCNSAHFIQDLITDDGPYPARHVAYAAGKGVAIDWCWTNNVPVQEFRHTHISEFMG